MKKDKVIVATFLKNEGGSAGLYTIKGSKTIGFKEFLNKKDAIFAHKIQTKLSKLGLAPKVYSKITKIKIETKYIGYNDTYYESSGWGFLTQIVKVKKNLSLKKIQKLVNDIHKKANLSFWDCHEFNIGIYRDKYLCIDTGRESFDADCNAWGMISPGPKCSECKKYSCGCGWLL